MKKRKITLFGLIALVSLLSVFVSMKISGGGFELTSESFAKDAETALTFDTKSTGSTHSGDALIVLTPQVVENNRLVVKFRINTHSVRLSQFDLTQITTLEYDRKILKPIKASRIGGHHSAGKIIFDVREEIGIFRIKIKGIPKIKERVYEWNVG
jgi:hypothetical protein